MHNRSLQMITAALAATASLTIASSSSAQVLVFEDFAGDATPADSIFSANGFEGSSGNDVTFTRAIDPTGGPDGSEAFVLSADGDADGISSNPDGTATFFFGAAQYFNTLNLAGFAASDLRLTADIAARTTNDSIGDVLLVIVDQTTGQGFNFGATLDGNGTFQNVGGTLDTATGQTGDALSDGDYSIFVQFNNAFPGAAYDFGANAENDIIFDNVTLAVVPEPASLGLVAATGLLGLRRRR